MVDAGKGSAHVVELGSRGCGGIVAGAAGGAVGGAAAGGVARVAAGDGVTDTGGKPVGLPARVIWGGARAGGGVVGGGVVGGGVDGGGAGGVESDRGGPAGGGEGDAAGTSPRVVAGDGDAPREPGPLRAFADGGRYAGGTMRSAAAAACGWGPAVEPPSDARAGGGGGGVKTGAAGRPAGGATDPGGAADPGGRLDGGGPFGGAPLGAGGFAGADMTVVFLQVAVQQVHAESPRTSPVSMPPVPTNHR